MSISVGQKLKVKSYAYYVNGEGWGLMISVDR